MRPRRREVERTMEPAPRNRLRISLAVNYISSARGVIWFLILNDSQIVLNGQDLVLEQ